MHTFEAKSQGNSSAIKRPLLFGKSNQKTTITNSATKNLAKNLANNAIDKAPDVIDSLSNRANNETIKKHQIITLLKLELIKELES